MSHRVPDGLRALDAARAACGPQIQEVRKISMIHKFKVNVKLDEAAARRVPQHFADQREISVHTQENALGSYVMYSYKLDEKNSTIAVQEWTLDEKRIVEDFTLNPESFT